MSRTRISLAPLIPYGMIASFIGIFGVGFYEMIVDDKVDTKVREASQKTESNVKYLLLDANTITREEGTLSYTFNFLSRHVLIAGYANGMEIQAGFSFAGFDNPAMIESVRKTGCDAARHTAGELAEFDSGSLIFSGPPDDAANKEAEARHFIKNHCPAQP
jgi:hypothetical protein